MVIYWNFGILKKKMKPMFEKKSIKTIHILIQKDININIGTTVMVNKASLLDYHYKIVTLIFAGSPI